MTTAEIGADLLDRGQRRLLLGVCIVVGAGTTVSASYNLMLVPMRNGLGARESQGALLRQLPSIAALLILFLAGVLGYRWGERRFIAQCGVLFTVGSAVVAVASHMGVAVAGLVLENVGASGLFVAALALLSARVGNPEARASAFATYSMVAPFVYLGMPLLAGVIVDESSWRLVPVVWVLGGVAIVVASRVLLPTDSARHDPRELVTPALAGVVLAAAVQTVSFADRDGVLSVAALTRLAVGLVAFVVLYRIFRRTASPSLSLAALRQGGMAILLVVVILVSFANLWFYMTLGFQYLYGLGAFQTAVVMLPAQAAGIGGAMIARRVLRRRGITVAGTVLLTALALSLLLSADSPIWIPGAVISLYAAASVGASIPLTNAIMNTAPQNEEGSAAAFRSAAGNIGAAVGVVVMSTIVFGTFTGSLTNKLSSEGLKSKQSASIAESIRAGVTSEDVSANYAVPLEQVNEIAKAQREAMADGLRAHGLRTCLRRIISAAKADGRVLAQAVAS